VRNEDRTLALDDIVGLLAGAADVALGPGLEVSQLDHALQTATFVGAARPGDAELTVAALVHDLGHLLPGVGDEDHARAGADAVRSALGERVATLVGLHVEAKRYLVATDPGYGDMLAPDSTGSLVGQGGALRRSAASSFRARPLAEAALALRRADDRAKCAGVVVEPLEHWVRLLHQLSLGTSRTGT
jgi:predicted HD phosphohydrolase